MSPSSTPEKCEAIVRRIVELANTGTPVVFEEDWGGNSLTICLGPGHTHVGLVHGTFDLLVDNLYDSLHGGPGLSWAVPQPKEIVDDNRPVVSDPK